MTIDAPHSKIGYSDKSSDPFLDYLLKYFHSIKNDTFAYMHRKDTPDHAKSAREYSEKKLKEIEEEIKNPPDDVKDNKERLTKFLSDCFKSLPTKH